MSSIQLTADTLASTPGAGQKEFNGTIFTGAPTATTRGIIPTEQFYALNSGLAGTQALTAQNILGVGVTLAGSTQYEFEAVFAISKSAGTTSHTIALGFGGTATINNIGYEGMFMYGTSFNPINNGAQFFLQTASSTVVSPAITNATEAVSVFIKGIVSVNAGGTFIPQYTLSAAPGGAYTTQAGSYMKIKPIGASGANVSVGSWA